MGSHERTSRCVDCRSGEHDMGCSETWWTTFLHLVRRQCQCEDCNCMYGRVVIMYPRHNRKHAA